MIQRTSYRLFGKFCDKIKGRRFEKKLKQSRLFVPFPMYTSLFLFSIFLIGMAGFLSISLLCILYLTEKIEKQIAMHSIFWVVVVILGVTGVILMIFLSLPYLLAYDKRIKIEQQLPFAVNYMSAMAVAGVRSEVIFKTMAGKKLTSVYGELSKELSIFEVQTDFFGKDQSSALHILSIQTPSPLFSDFLRGAKNTFISGGSFQSFILSKKQEYQSLAIQRKEKYFQTLELLSEIYITSFLAAPLFMMILLFTTMTFSGPKSEQMKVLTYQIVPFLGIFFLLILEIINEKEEG